MHVKMITIYTLAIERESERERKGEKSLKTFMFPFQKYYLDRNIESSIGLEIMELVW